MLRCFTAGESHGPALTAIIDGLPAGLVLDADAIDRDLRRRQGGYGRGGRQQIERDQATITAGVVQGMTIARPWPSPLPIATGRTGGIAPWRPGAARARATLTWRGPRSMAWTTCASSPSAPAPARRPLGWPQVPCVRRSWRRLGCGWGAMSRRLVACGRTCRGWRSRSVSPAPGRRMSPAPTPALPRRCARPSMPPVRPGIPSVAWWWRWRSGARRLGSHSQWDRRLDGRLAQAVMSVQAVKGSRSAPPLRTPPSPAPRCDALYPAEETVGRRARAHQGVPCGARIVLGGVEGGMSNGAPSRCARPCRSPPPSAPNPR